MELIFKNFWLMIMFSALSMIVACSAQDEVSSEFRCLQEIPKTLEAQFNNYQLAQTSDFVTSIRNYASENDKNILTCSIFEADFNRDRLNDYALLLIAEDKTHFRFLILLNQGKEKFTEALVKDYQTVNQLSEGIIYTSMSYKPSGELGIAQREYSPIKPDTPEGKTFIAAPAIELWEAIKDNKTNLPLDLELDTLAYCSEVFYWQEENFKTVIVCD